MTFPPTTSRSTTAGRTSWLAASVAQKLDISATRHRLAVKRGIRLITILLCLLASATELAAHEFRINPVDGTGRDRRTGMKTEFVALANPCAPDDTQEMIVEIISDGAPRADAQVKVFEKAADRSVAITFMRTDSAGIARFPTKTGHNEPVDAVLLREPDPAQARVVWKTLWAALTFAVPPR